MLDSLIRLTPKPVSRLSLSIIGKQTYGPFARRLPNASKFQRDWLLNRVRKCRETKFGRDHAFGEVRTLEDFRKRVPISEYDYFAPYIQAVAAGETAALIPAEEKLLQFTITTGSSGVPKLNPVTETWLREYKKLWAVWGIKLFNDHPKYIGKRILQMAGTWNMGTTPGGYQISMVSALLARIQNPLLRPYYAIPEILNDVKDPVARHYAALRLCIPLDIGWIMLMNPGTLIRLAEISDGHSEKLIRDIADGTLTDHFEFPQEVRDALTSSHLKPNKAASKKLEAIVNRTGRLLPKDFWQQPVVGCWLGGTAGFQSRYIEEYFGSSPMRDMGLVSSEGRHTVPLIDTEPYGVPAMGAGFYEFVPVDDQESSQLAALEGHELEVDRDYRLLMTTSAGYFRFDIGDIVRCRGFEGQAPLLEFIQKSARVGDLEGEKLTEHQVVEGAHRAAKALGMELGLITAVPRRLENQQPRYDFIVEKNDFPDANRAVNFLTQLDSELAGLNFLWKARRNEGVLASPLLHRLHENEWQKYIQSEVDRRGTGDYQYKHPGLVQQEDWIQQLSIADTLTLA